MTKTSSRRKTFQKLVNNPIPNSLALNKAILVGIAYKDGQQVRDRSTRLSECDGLLEGHVVINDGKLLVYQPPEDGYWIPIA